MKTYEKIETIYARDIEGTKKLIPGEYRNETVKYLKDCEWIWTEKVDGTNIRVYWDGHSVTFGGRTDKAQIPAALVNRLNELFGGEENAQMFEQIFGEREAILFGEGYGKKIQAVGSAYKPDGVDFILFDVWIKAHLPEADAVGQGPTADGRIKDSSAAPWGNYQEREWVEETARAFGCGVVPVVGRGKLEDAVE